jgi:anti-sigma-K factor RskA
MATGDSELHTLVGAYVMDAVTDDERARYTRHLTDCPGCRAEIRELRETAARLGTAAGVHPRAELRSQTIRAAGRIAQLPPAFGARTPDAGHRPGHGRPWRRPAMRSPATAAAVVLLAGAALLGMVTKQTMRQLDHSRRQSHLIATVLGAPDVVMLTAKVSSGGTATVMMSHREHALVFTARGLRALPTARSYELWVMGPEGDRPAGMLSAARDGMTGPAIVSGLAAGDMIALTVEPTAGSPRPTSAPLVLIGPKSG